MYAGAADGNRTRMMFPPWDFRTTTTFVAIAVCGLDYAFIRSG